MTRTEFTKKISQLLVKMSESGDNPIGHEWFRTQEQQDLYWLKGRKLIDGKWTIIGDVVTFTQNSSHKTGLALDIYLTNEIGSIVWDCTKPGLEKYKDRLLYWHSVWDKDFGGKPMIDKPNFRDFPHFEG